MDKSKISISKDNFRKLMKEKKSVKKIEHSLAKYNKIGQLVCTSCQTIIKSEHIWPAHLLSKSHKQNVESIKNQSSKQSFDKEKSSHSEPPHKKIALNKSSKDTGTASLVSNYAEEDADTLNKSNSESKLSSDPLPEDFFDTKVTQRVISTPVNSTATQKKEPEEQDTALPEGFFDDPYVDAKVRQVPFKDKLDEEYELFQKAMKEVSHKSEQLIEEDDDKLMSRRNLSEVEDQLYRWTKINQLEIKKEELASKLKSGDSEERNSLIGKDESSDDDVDPEAVNWRQKK